MPAIITRLPRAITLVTAVFAGLLGHAKEESLELFGQQSVLVAVPDGWSYQASRTDNGLVLARLSDPDNRISLQLTFFPDPDARMADGDNQTALMEDLAMEYIGGSVEKAAKLEPLRPRRGSGLYCVFTDAKLTGLTELPPDEYRHATTGVRSADGWFVVFTLLSQDTGSPAYRRALGLLRHGLDPAAAAVKRARDPRAF
jgi:hypothetical protein